jgi:hypothetical protein
MLFVKDIPKFSEVINKYEYKTVDPYDFIFNKPEFENRIRLNPDGARSE